MFKALLFFSLLGSYSYAESVFTIDPVESDTLWIQLVKYDHLTSCNDTSEVLISDSDIVKVPPVFPPFESVTVVVDEPPVFPAPASTPIIVSSKEGVEEPPVFPPFESVTVVVNEPPVFPNPNGRANIVSSNEFKIETQIPSVECAGNVYGAKIIQTNYKKIKVTPGMATTIRLTGGFDYINVASVNENFDY